MKKPTTRPGISQQQQSDEPAASVYKERVNYLTLLLALAVFVVGFAILVTVNSLPFLQSHLTISAVLREFGALLIASVSIPLFWELRLKRALLDEVMARARRSLAILIGEARLADDVRVAGLKVFTNEFAYGITWQELFQEAKKFDSFFVYARTWIGTHSEQLGELARREGARIRMVLPDPENADLMAQLARRFDRTPDQVKRDIEATIKELLAIFVVPFKNSNSKPDFSLYFTAVAPLFSFYRFDDTVVVALYKHRTGRGGKILVFVGEQGGTIFSFVVEEMHSFLDESTGLTKRIFPERTIA